MNILPEKNKRILKIADKMRVLFVYSLALLCVECVWLLAVLPSYAGIVRRIEPVGNQYAGDISQKETQNLLVNIGSNMATSSIVQILRSVQSVKPDGVRIEQIIYSYSRPATLVLSGTSDSRDSLSQFRDTLQASSAFSRVSIPVEALVGKGSFSASLDIANQ